MHHVISGTPSPLHSCILLGSRNPSSHMHWASPERVPGACPTKGSTCLSVCLASYISTCVPLPIDVSISSSSRIRGFARLTSHDQCCIMLYPLWCRSFLHTLRKGLQHLDILEPNGEETFVFVDGVEAFKPALELIAWPWHDMD